MSITTRSGDGGSTSLLYGRRVPKHDPRIEACGEVDELGAALGLARSLRPGCAVALLERVQRELIPLMGELALDAADRERHRGDAFGSVTPEMVSALDVEIARLEDAGVGRTRGWAIPGADPASSSLDLARAICRRAERRVSGLEGGRGPGNPEILRYLNRLSDLLWLLAREAEGGEGPRGCAIPG